MLNNADNSSIENNTKTANVLSSIYNAPSAAAKKTSKTIAINYKVLKPVLIIISLILVGIVFSVIWFYFGIGRSNTYTTNYTLIKSTSKIISSKLDYYVPLNVEMAESMNLLNGELVTETEYNSFGSLRPIGVMVENHVDARPQSGLSDADIIYETLAEGGISRYLAIFWSKNPIQIGPIRSVRTYYLDLFSEYDGILEHIGQAGYSLSDPNRDKYKIIDALRYMSENKVLHTGCGVYRDQQRLASGVAVEHTAYSDIQRIRDCTASYNWEKAPNVMPWLFKSDAIFSERALSSSAELNFLNSNSSNSYSVAWSYDNTSNTYKRTLAGKEDKDKNNGKNITVKNLIFQYADMQTFQNQSSRIFLNTIGSGKAKIMMDGKVLDATWKKDIRTSRTRYYTSDNKEIVFNRGKFWITIVPANKGTPIGKLDLK